MADDYTGAAAAMHIPEGAIRWIKLSVASNDEIISALISSLHLH
jgi:hypothetical protein